MTDIAVEFEYVWKKFRKGEIHDSLRDLIPSMARALLSRNHQGELEAKEFWALSDISFRVKRGEALGIIGPNGAGKSTILKLLSGILKPNKGHIKVNGRLSALIEVGAGFHPDLTGRENIYLNGAILGMRKADIDKKFDDIVEFSDLADFIDTPVKRYSSGMYARLGFSVAAHVDPDILLVDEVLSVGDIRFQERCLQKMLSFANGGTTVVFVSHNLGAVNSLCPRTAFLSNSRLEGLGPTSEVIRDYIASVQEHDRGSQGGLLLWGISLRDENEQTVNKLSPGQRAYMRFKLRNDLPFKDCLLGFLIRRASDGLSICDYNLPLDCVKRGRECGEGVDCALAFETNLLRGAYVVQLYINHYPTSKQLIKVADAAFFSVEERISWNGVAHLNPVVIPHGD